MKVRMKKVNHHKLTVTRIEKVSHNICYISHLYSIVYIKNATASYALKYSRMTNTCGNRPVIRQSDITILLINIKQHSFV